MALEKAAGVPKKGAVPPRYKCDAGDDCFSETPEWSKFGWRVRGIDCSGSRSGVAGCAGCRSQ